MLDSRYNQLRKYTPALVKYLEFSSTNTSMEPLIDTIMVINDINETGKRRVPDNAPLGFIPNRWNKFVFEPGGTINKHYYEFAAYAELKNKIRSGDVAVKGSRNYRNFDEYLVTKKEGDNKKASTSKLAVSTSMVEYLQERTESLNKRLQWVLNSADKLNGVSIGNDRIHVDRLEKVVPEGAMALSERLYKLASRVKLLIS